MYMLYEATVRKQHETWRFTRCCSNAATYAVCFDVMIKAHESPTHPQSNAGRREAGNEWIESTKHGHEFQQKQHCDRQTTEE